MSGRTRKLRNGLTPKQNMFTKVVLKQIKETGQMNGTQAALESYDTTDPVTAASISHEVIRNPQVKLTIEEALEHAGLGLEAVVSELKPIATAQVEKISGDVKLRAIDSILKLHGAYPSKKSVHMNLNMSAKFKGLDYSKAKEQLEESRKMSDVFISEPE